MSRPEPKFAVGEAVMIRSIQRPYMNVNYTKVSKVFWFESNFNPIEGWAYFTEESCPKSGWMEQALRSIPKEEQNGIDAYEFIKRYTGEIA
tara:strand:+ start:1175 stop:1447 length:273 start_codon:yes stop_codon:yes gene_type:complete